MPGRVEWSELGGDEAETVLANLLYSERTSSTRVRPSRGDFGIDVLDPSKREAAMYGVYQIKRYAKTLTASQKKEVEKSFRRVLVGLVRREPPVPLGDWYLIAPVDNTVDNELDWFRSMPDRVIDEMFEDAELALTEEEKQRITAWRNAPGRIIKWEGRQFCETLAGKYPTLSTITLTPTEHDVVRLVSDGLGNKDIATRLFISPRTVQTHLTHVYTKLGLTSRLQLVQEAARHT